jgi:DNA-binding NarL/FixJ family response regulator
MDKPSSGLAGDASPRAAHPLLRVVVVEDHDLVRAGMCALLTAMDGITVVGQAKDGYEALELTGRIHPDVILLDLTMPGLDGLATLGRMAGDYPDVRVLVVSMHCAEEYVWEALRAGAAGYVLKDSSPGDFATAVRTIAAGDLYLSPAVSRLIVSEYVDHRPEGRVGAASDLSPRQIQIIRLIAYGHTNREIADELKIGVKTVETHRAELMTRLDIHDVPGLVRYAIRNGLITADS